MNPTGTCRKNYIVSQKKIRCEKIGSSYFKGVKNNIEKFYQKKGFWSRFEKQ